jgi:peptide/nickel transport system permease protein
VPRAQRLISLAQHWPGVLGAVLMLALLSSAALAPWIAPQDPNAVDMANRLQAPSVRHMLGTDPLGRDELSRLLYGGRAGLSIAFLAVLITSLLAMLVGTVAGYVGGLVDQFVSALLLIVLALPGLILQLTILGILGTGVQSLLIALVGGSWAGDARILRGAVLVIREEAYVEAARSIGARQTRILVRHVAPALLPTVSILATTQLGTLLLTVSALSFLGIGIRPPDADWGAMLSDSRTYFSSDPLLLALPAACIVAFALASNLVGDALRDQFSQQRT